MRIILETRALFDTPKEPVIAGRRIVLDDADKTRVDMTDAEVLVRHLAAQIVAVMAAARGDAERVTAEEAERSGLSQDMRDCLRRWIVEARRVAEPVGPIHGLWDVIFDAEALLKGNPTLLRGPPAEVAETCILIFQEAARKGWA